MLMGRDINHSLTVFSKLVKNALKDLLGDEFVILSKYLNLIWHDTIKQKNMLYQHTLKYK